MKKNKIISSVFSLFLGVQSIIALNTNADSPIMISASNEIASAGSEFSITVSLSDIPTNGVQVVDLSVSYDASLVQITSIDAGEITETGAEEFDPTFNLGFPVLSTNVNESTSEIVTQLVIATELNEYWIHQEGTLFTINGIVLDDVADGSVAEFNIKPVNRLANNETDDLNDLIYIGYSETDKTVNYDYTVSNGSLTVENQADNTGSTSDMINYGDANCDGQIDIADVVAICDYVANFNKSPLSELGMLNADVHQLGDGVSAADAMTVQQFLSHTVPLLPTN